MVRVQLIANSTLLVRGKVVLQADAWGLPRTRAEGPRLPLHPSAVVRWSRGGP